MSENPFAAFAATLNDEQREALLSALSGTQPPQTEVPQKRGRGRPKKVVVVEEAAPTKGAKKVVTKDFQVVREDGKSMARKQAVQFRGNSWKDTGQLRSKQTATPEYEPTPRERPAAEYVIKRCHVCGRDFEINKALLHGEFHRCSKCT